MREKKRSPLVVSPNRKKPSLLVATGIIIQRTDVDCITWYFLDTLSRVCTCAKIGITPALVPLAKGRRGPGRL